MAHPSTPNPTTKRTLPLQSYGDGSVTDFARSISAWSRTVEPHSHSSSGLPPTLPPLITFGTERHSVASRQALLLYRKHQRSVHPALLFHDAPVFPESEFQNVVSGFFNGNYCICDHSKLIKPSMEDGDGALSSGIARTAQAQIK
jgi:hypothetical protein